MTRPPAKPSDPTLTPKLRFPEFRREPWREKLIGDFLAESRVKGSSGDIARKLTVKLWARGVFEKIAPLSGSENTQYYRRKSGQFIYSKLDFLNQAFGIIPPELDDLESTVDLPCFDISNELHSNFLLEYVKRPAFYEKFGEIADGGRKAKRIQAESFLSFPIRVPQQFAEQKKIAECLSTLDELIGAESQKLDALKAHKKGLMQQLFPREGEILPRLRFPVFRKTKIWRERKISEILTKASLPVEVEEGRTYREIGVRSHGKGVFHKNPVDGKILGEKRVFQVIPNALVLNIVFAWEQSVANTSDEEIDMVASHRFPMYVPKADDCDVRFIKYAFLTPQGKHLLGIASPGGAGRNRTLGQYEFEQLQIFAPSKDEQIEIADTIDTAGNLIAVQSDKLKVLLTHKQGLTQHLFPSTVDADV